MKLSRKRGPEEDAPPPAAPPPPTPPRGAPVSAYAAILDGETLWLAVDAAPGSLALRAVESGEVHALTSDIAEDDPAYRSVRAGLLGLPEAEAAYDVVLVPPGARGPKQVWSAPFAKLPTRVPMTRDGRWQFALVRTEDGMLRVRRAPATEGLDVHDLSADDDGLRVVFAGTDATELRLVEDETVLAAYPVTRDGDRSIAVITEAALPEGTGQLGRLLAGETPLRRRANDLGNPHHAVLLPVLFGDDPDLARLRLRWSPEGHLVGRVVDRDEGGSDR